MVQCGGTPVPCGLVLARHHNESTEQQQTTTKQTKKLFVSTVGSKPPPHRRLWVCLSALLSCTLLLGSSSFLDRLPFRGSPLLLPGRGVSSLFLRLALPFRRVPGAVGFLPPGQVS